MNGWENLYLNLRSESVKIFYLTLVCLFMYLSLCGSAVIWRQTEAVALVKIIPMFYSDKFKEDFVTDRVYIFENFPMTTFFKSVKIR